MKTVENISQYVEDVFDQYGMNKDRFFFDYDVEADEQYPIPLFPNGNPDEETLNRISTQLGISKDEILRISMSFSLCTATSQQCGNGTHSLRMICPVQKNS